MFLGIKPDQWYSCPFEIPQKCAGHKTTIHDEYLWTVGGVWKSSSSSCCKEISNVLLKPSFTVSSEGEVPQPISYHNVEVIGNDILIIGGSTSGYSVDAVDTFLSYSTATKNIVQMSPLPFPMLDMATAQIGEDILIIGDRNKRHKSLNTMFKYNYKTMQ